MSKIIAEIRRSGKTASALLAMIVVTCFAALVHVPARDDGTPVSTVEVSCAVLKLGDSLYLTTNGEYKLNVDDPQWLVGVVNDSGLWQTNPPTSWYVHSEASNDTGHLSIVLDRSILTNNAAGLRLTFFDTADSSLYLDLADASAEVVATNLAGNLLSGSMVMTMTNIVIPLAAYPGAIAIDLRRGTGEIAVYEAQLYACNAGFSQVGAGDIQVNSSGEGISARGDSTAKVSVGESCPAAGSYGARPVLNKAGAKTAGSRVTTTDKSMKSFSARSLAYTPFAIALGSPFWNVVTVQDRSGGRYGSTCNVYMTCAPSAKFTATGNQVYTTNLTWSSAESCVEVDLVAIGASSGVDTDTVSTVFSAVGPAGTWGSTSSWTYTSVALDGVTNRHIIDVGTNGFYTTNFTATTIPTNCSCLISDVLCWRGGGMPASADYTNEFLTRLAPGVYTVQVINAWSPDNRNEFVETVVGVDIVPDFNHDRIIDSTDKSELVSNGTFRFWINDDADRGDVADGDSDLPGYWGGLGSANYSYSRVCGRCDLLDFFPVWLDLSQILNLFPPGSTVQYKLKQADGAIKAVYTDLTKEQAGRYLTNECATCGPNFNKNSYKAEKFKVTSSGVTLSTNFLNKIKGDAPKGILLMEGAAETTEPLVLEVWKDGVKICEKKMELSINGVEKMYRLVNLRNMTNPGTVGAPSNNPDSLSNGKNLVYLHGYQPDLFSSKDILSRLTVWVIWWFRVLLLIMA